MRLYIKFLILHLKCQMQYKTSFFLLAAGQFLVSFTAFIGMYFMFGRFHTVGGFTLEQSMMCFSVVLMAFALAEMFGRGFDTFPQMLGNGEFDRALVRPRGVIFQVLAAKMEFSRISRILQAVVMLFYAIPRSGIIWSSDKIITLLLMIICGSVLFFALFILYAAISFFTVEGLEFMNIFTDGGREFGMYPYAIYGDNILKILTYVIPLAMFQYYPLLYLLDMEQSRLYMFAPLIAALFILPCYAFFRVGVRRYKSTGS